MIKNNKKFECSYCKKKFTTPKYLIKHITITCKSGENELSINKNKEVK